MKNYFPILLFTLLALLSACSLMQFKTNDPEAGCWFNKNKNPIDRVHPGEIVYISMKTPEYADGEIITAEFYISYLYEIHNNTGKNKKIEYSGKDNIPQNIQLHDFAEGIVKNGNAEIEWTVFDPLKEYDIKEGVIFLPYISFTIHDAYESEQSGNAVLLDYIY